MEHNSRLLYIQENFRPVTTGHAQGRHSIAKHEGLARRSEPKTPKWQNIYPKIATLKMPKSYPINIFKVQSKSSKLAI